MDFDTLLAEEGRAVNKKAKVALIASRREGDSELEEMRKRH